MNRRKFLVTGAAAAGGIAAYYLWPFARNRFTRADKEYLASLWLWRYEPFGLPKLAAEGSVRDALAFLRGAHGNKKAMDGLLHTQVERDLAQGNARRIDGWLFAETELNLVALLTAPDEGMK